MPKTRWRLICGRIQYEPVEDWAKDRLEARMTDEDPLVVTKVKRIVLIRLFGFGILWAAVTYDYRPPYLGTIRGVHIP